MKKILAVIPFFYLFSALNLFPKIDNPVKFEWNFQLNRTFSVDKYTLQTIIKNGEIVYKKMIRDYVVFKPVEKVNGFYHLIGKYFSYSKNLLENSLFHLENEYDLDFRMNKQGEYKVLQSFVQPSIRNIPYFPDRKLTPGDTWTNVGYEILEFQPRIKLPVHVEYLFAGYEKINGENLAKISFSYLWNHKIDHKNPELPYRFLGHSFSLLWYNTNTKQPVFTKNIYDLSMIYYNGTMIEYRGDLKGYYNLKRNDKEQEKTKNAIFNNLKKSDNDLEVRKEDENIIVTLGEIYFEFDKSTLTDDAKNKLKKLGKVLKKYHNYRILIKGHTDNIGDREYNKVLSEKRAFAVLNFLVRNNFIDRNIASYKGMGEEEPLYSNSTPEGRKKNRRVEIIITPE